MEKTIITSILITMGKLKMQAAAEPMEAAVKPKRRAPAT
jgi:hypothetical protein